MFSIQRLPVGDTVVTCAAVTRATTSGCFSSP
jgi:hypothetical protein